MAHEAGKGSAPRPFSVSHEEWSNRWDAIFGRDLETKNKSDEVEERHTRNNAETQLVKENKY